MQIDKKMQQNLILVMIKVKNIKWKQFIIAQFIEGSQNLDIY